jgi:hypothetical protein
MPRRKPGQAVAVRKPQSSRVLQQKKAKQGRFLDSFLDTANVSRSCTVAGIHRQTHYDWMRDDPEYAVAFREAEEHAADLLEAEARRRAIEGVEEPAGWYQGKPGGTVTRYSDTLLIFLLKGARPEKYRERIEHTGAGGEPLFKVYQGVDTDRV